MRCPYCNGINTERARFCVHCGRDMRAAGQTASRQQPPDTVQGYPPTTQRQQPAYAPPPSQPQQAPRVRQQALPLTPPTPPAPEAPAPFPPRTMAQLQALEQGALPYTVVDTTTQ